MDRGRYETLIEVLDTRTGLPGGSATAAGFPISLLPDRRAPVYGESEDGTPRIEVIQYFADAKPQ